MFSTISVMGKRLNSYFYINAFQSKIFLPSYLTQLLDTEHSSYDQVSYHSSSSHYIITGILKCTLRAFGLTVLSKLISVPFILTLCLCGDLHADTDSGLGRATPPRRAPSPGMGGSHAVGRHLPSPSGPGSLPPGLIAKRRMFDDGSSDISSAQSSMMDYTGKVSTISGSDRSSRDRLREP